MKQLPNMITLGNLLCGSVAVVLAGTSEPGLSEPLQWACYLIFLAAVLDFFDGMVARLVGADSAMGRELDSLADVVSFGLVPSVIALYSSLIINTCNPAICLLPLLLVLGAAWRLARFNTDPSQSEYFKGLPAPANGIFWASVVLWHQEYLGGVDTISDPGPSFDLYYVIGIVIMFLLMVSKLKLLNFKPKELGWKGNESRYFILAGIVISLAICQIVFSSLYAGIVLSLLLYLIVSLVHFYILKPHEIQSRN